MANETKRKKNEVWKHSPGPWHGSQRFGGMVADQNGNYVANLNFDDLESKTRLANERLVAAAPDLLRIVKEFLEAGIEHKVNSKYSGYFDDFREIVAKAEVRS